LNHHSATVLPKEVTKIIFQHVEKARFPKVEPGRTFDFQVVREAAKVAPMIVANHIQSGLVALRSKSFCQFFYPNGSFQPLVAAKQEAHATTSLLKTFRPEEMIQFYPYLATRSRAARLFVTLFSTKGTTHRIEIFPEQCTIVDPMIGTIRFSTRREFDADLIRLPDAYRNWFGGLRGIAVEQ
jgi:hypothetical protein